MTTDDILKTTFDTNTVNYDKYRPRYTKALFDEVIEYAKIKGGSRVLEVGIGAGQATRPFLEADCFVTGVDIGENMVAYCNEIFKEYAKFKALRISFEEYCADEKYDLIYSATAFHWIAEEIGYPKAFSMLKGGGALAVFRNHPFVEANDPVDIKIQKVYEKYTPDSKKGKQFVLEDTAPTVKAMERAGFTEITPKLFKGERCIQTEDYIGLLNTYSDHIVMDKKIKPLFEEGIREAMNSEGGRINIKDTIELVIGRRP
ncbi:MAG: class I SAM-dependent methyltransferase [Eubacteriaceae bacterium]|nr:class I SAM-dependent methyltransferase [Eubacteriaceae bacterium]